jgi:F0F1-type ATP synthase assembly protein I
MPDIPPQKPASPQPPLINVWSLAGEIGFILALPLVILVVLGVKVDKHFGTTPLFIIVGMLLSMVISATAIIRKVRRLKL